jgi:hypothetical protein
MLFFSASTNESKNAYTIMKHAYLSIFLSVLFLSTHAQDVSTDSTGLLGDDFSLEGALAMFKESADPEEFEMKINDSDNHVNNLDLNEDGDVDYIRVTNYTDEDVHVFVLQAMISEDEIQDVAAIEIEKTGSENAVLQIVGDEALYGENVIVEPYEEGAEGGSGGPGDDAIHARIVVNVWFWPFVRTIYAPGYVVYSSPWYWGYYPRWWNPWRPRPWRSYYTGGIHFRVSFRPAPVHRVVRAHRVYTPVRRSSPVVVTRSRTRVSTRTVSNTRVRTSTTRSTTVVNKDGKAAARTTTTKKAGVSSGNKKAGVSQTTTKTVRSGKDGKVATKSQKTTAKAQGKNRAVSKKTTKKTAKAKSKSGKTGVKKTKKTTVKKKKR